MHILAYLSKINLVISFVQMEFLRGVKWANYEWCHGREHSHYQQCGEKRDWKQTRGTRGFKDVGRLMQFHRQLIKSLSFFTSMYSKSATSFSFALVKTTCLMIASCCSKTIFLWVPQKSEKLHREEPVRRKIKTHSKEIKQIQNRGRDLVNNNNNNRQNNKERTGTRSNRERTRIREQMRWEERRGEAVARWGGP